MSDAILEERIEAALAIVERWARQEGSSPVPDHQNGKLMEVEAVKSVLEDCLAMDLEYLTRPAA